MIKLAHFSAFIFGPFEKLMFGVLKCFFIKEFLALIRPFLSLFRLALNLNECVALVFWQLLQLDVCDFMVIEMLI